MPVWDSGLRHRAKPAPGYIHFRHRSGARAFSKRPAIETPLVLPDPYFEKRGTLESQLSDGAFLGREERGERHCDRPDERCLTSECRRPQHKVSEVEELRAFRKLLADGRRYKRPGFVHRAVDNYRICVQRPYRIENAEAKVPRGLVQRRASGWVAFHCELAYLPNLLRVTAGRGASLHTG